MAKKNNMEKYLKEIPMLAVYTVAQSCHVKDF